MFVVVTHVLADPRSIPPHVPQKFSVGSLLGAFTASL